MKKCEFCEEKYHGLRGLHIHQNYCWVKKFKELPIKYCSHQEAQDLLDNSYFIPNWRYWPKSLFKYIEKGEVGMLKGKRYIIDPLLDRTTKVTNMKVNRILGKFAPNLGHDPDNPFPLGKFLTERDLTHASRTVRIK
jgi:hypothetical protein